MIRDAIDTIVGGGSLSMDEAAQVMNEIMDGEATPAQFGAFVTTLRLKGETVDEVVGMTRTMRQKSLHVEVDGPLVDTCGTGGDASGTFNISTTAGFVVAGAGARVAKHGNRAMSGACGSADVLDALGVKIDLGPDGVGRCLEEVGYGFMFAQTFHPSMRFAAGPRREIGIRTVFNILGPLTNPAGARSQLIGVADPGVAETMASVLATLGSTHAVVVHGRDGLDEITLSDTTDVWELRDGNISTYSVTPEELGLERVNNADIGIADAREGAQKVRDVLGGAAGPERRMVLANAAGALLAADKAATLYDGVALAAESIDSGAALGKLDALVALSQKIG
jgi:anthranilate phosphoribosyltransferase